MSTEKTNSILEATLHGLGAGLHVKHISEYNMHTCAPEDDAASILRSAQSQDFDRIPVSQGGRVIGVEGSIVGRGTVRDCMRALDDSMLISSEESILNVLAALSPTGFRLVLQGAKITGIVTTSDISKLPVRLLVFALVSELEVAMNSVIARKYPGDTWMNQLQDSGRLRDRLARRREANLSISALEVAQFSEKRKAISKILQIADSDRRQLERVECIRNDAAHGNELAATAAEVSQFTNDVLSIEDWVSRLDKWSDLAKVLPDES